MIVEVGKIYQVKIDDCCVYGSFTSKVRQILDINENSITSEKDNEYGTTFIFENGVTIVQENGLTFTLVDRNE